MGTSNRLAQFEGMNFIELLEVDRPRALARHDLDATPPVFSFGDHNRRFLSKREGLAMLVFAGHDSRGDVEDFHATGIDTYAPFDFERQATLPDGSQVTVEFSLAFATSRHMPNLAFFTCHNRSPEHFWKPNFQRHANGARGITRVYVVADEPALHGDFFQRLVRGELTSSADGISIACANQQTIWVLSPEQMSRQVGDRRFDLSDGPVLAGLQITSDRPPSANPQDMCGMFIEWATPSAD